MKALLCSVKPELLCLCFSLQKNNLRKRQYLQNHLEVVRFGFAEIHSLIYASSTIWQLTCASGFVLIVTPLTVNVQYNNNYFKVSFRVFFVFLFFLGDLFLLTGNWGREGEWCAAKVSLFGPKPRDFPGDHFHVRSQNNRNVCISPLNNKDLITRIVRISCLIGYWPNYCSIESMLELWCMISSDN